MRRATLAALAAVFVSIVAPAARSQQLPYEPPAVGAKASSGTVATRSLLVQRRLLDTRGRTLNGTGVSIAVIDTGVDPMHPALVLPNGSSKVVRSLSAAPCIQYGGESPFTHETSDDPSCIVDVPPTVQTDTGQGGHGTFISGVAVGNYVTLTDGTTAGGSAPGARIVMISATTALIGIINAFAWVIQHHRAPCGRAVPSAVCPPIKVVSLSWGADSPVIVRQQDALVRAGVVVVWANGNGGGDGSMAVSNKVATLDRTPGIIAAASYDDLGTGTRNGKISPSSSRGKASDPRTWPDISAPGVNIVSSCHPWFAVCTAIETQPPRDGPGPTDTATYFTGSGTSWSAPQIAGVVAMLFQLRPKASPAQIEDVLESTAYHYSDGAPYKRVGRYWSSFDKGTGLVDAYAAALRLGAVTRR